MTAEKPDNVIIRRAETPADYQACQEAQRLAWGIRAESDIVPIATLVGANRHGGLVLGAFRPDGTAAGLSFAFAAKIQGAFGLYSQLTGVVPGFQGQGLGRRLKQEQFAFAEAEGYACVAWAFDPLRIGNAHFNLDILGAKACEYVEDMYGPRTDALNAGVPTDRLIAVWRPGAAPVSEAAAGGSEAFWLLQAGPGADAEPEAWPLESAPVRLAIEVPVDPDALRSRTAARAAAWRVGVRTAFQDAFAAGYEAVATRRWSDTGGGRSAYVLAPRNAD